MKKTPMWESFCCRLVLQFECELGINASSLSVWNAAVGFPVVEEDFVPLLAPSG